MRPLMRPLKRPAIHIVTLMLLVTSPCNGQADDQQIMAACRRFLASDGQGKPSKVLDVESYSGDVDRIIAVLSQQTTLNRQDVSGVLKSQSFQHARLKAAHSDDLLHYFVPEAYELSKPFGLIIFMHGGGRTTAREHPLHVVTHPDEDPQSIGLQPYLAELPFILVAPSAPWNEKTGARWNVPEADAYIRGVIEESCHRFNIDRNRVILGGYSMGGFGALHLCQRLNDRLAGGFVFSGAWKTMHWKAWTGLPLFIRHGRNDASPPGEDGRGGRPRFTDVFYSRTAHKRLQESGIDHLYFEDDGDHRIRPASEAMKKMASWVRALRRNPYATHVVAVSPRGWNSSTDGPSPDSRWVTIHEIGDEAINYDRVVLHGPSPSFNESIDEFEKQSFELAVQPVKAGIVEATIESGNRIAVQTQNVRRFSLWLHPKMVDFSEPVHFSVNGIESSRRVRANLKDALRSYLRLQDWTQVYFAEVELYVDAK